MKQGKRHGQQPLFGMDAESSQGGFTLVEMMVALIILSVSILAFTSATLVSININLENDTRNTAVRLVSEVTEDLFGKDFEHADLAAGAHGTTYDVNIRGITKTFDVDWVVSSPSFALKQIEIIIGYDLKGKSHSNQAVVFRSDST